MRADGMLCALSEVKRVCRRAWTSGMGRLSANNESTPTHYKGLVFVFLNFLCVALVVLFQIYTGSAYEKSRTEVVNSAEDHIKLLAQVSRLSSHNAYTGLLQHTRAYLSNGKEKHYRDAQQNAAATADSLKALQSMGDHAVYAADMSIVEQSVLEHLRFLDRVYQTASTRPATSAEFAELMATPEMALPDPHPAFTALDNLTSSAVSVLQATKQQAGDISLSYLQRLMIGYAVIGVLVALLVVSALNYFRGLQKQKRDNRELALSEQRVNQLIDASPQALIVVNEQGLIERSNRIACDTLGYSSDELRDLSVEELLPAEYRDQHVQHRSAFANSGETRRNMAMGRELNVLRRNGTVFPAAIVISRMELDAETLFILMITDLSEQKQWTEVLLRTQRAQAIAALCSGIAHEFNNQLQVIESSVDLAEQNPEDYRQFLDKISEATHQSAELTSKLLSFSKQQVLNPRPVKLSDIFTELEKVIRSSAAATIALSIDTAGCPKPVFVDVDNLRNALLALTSNSIAAMPDGGELQISAQTCSYQGNDNELNLPGEYAVVEVVDSGHGIAPEILSMVKNPFFTTKGVGGGAGLGLSMADGFATQSNGALEISSKPGQGTRVVLFLPLSNSPQQPDAYALGESLEPSEEHSDPLTAATGGSAQPAAGRVLVLEDDLAVLALAEKILTHHGYEVVTATDADTALAAFGDGTDIDLIFSDVMLPCGKTGVDFVREAQKINPQVPALFASGFSQDLIQNLGTLIRCDGLLQKPYRARDLLDRLEALLREQKGNGGQSP